jgi:glycosyltransferase involved in cell wall biosynthesis
VLTGSAHSPHKNVGVLIEAMAALGKRVPGVVLVVPGNASEHSRSLERRAAELGLEDTVVFAGWLAPEDLEGLYGAAACFVLPSRREGFGLPLLEAMSRGVPVACAEASALPEVAGDAALYFDPDRADEVANAVARLVHDPALAEQLRAAGLRRAATFTWERVADETLTVYERALAE